MPISPWGLKERILDIRLEDRISYDAERNNLFLNFETLTVTLEQDVRDICDAVGHFCQPIGKRVDVVVNYGSFQIDADIGDSYAEMVGYLEQHYYNQVSRYATSAFMRMTLGGEKC